MLLLIDAANQGKNSFDGDKSSKQVSENNQGSRFAADKRGESVTINGSTSSAYKAPSVQPIQEDDNVKFTTSGEENHMFLGRKFDSRRGSWFGFQCLVILLLNTNSPDDDGVYHDSLSSDGVDDRTLSLALSFYSFSSFPMLSNELELTMCNSQAFLACLAVSDCFL
ncbi:hypothetical protein H0E87_001502 [Populus deltoides]|uniref:Uncharacterized protein n=1 Tax=Populus deltoides TaxID=3696 RepID=A0A8T2ZR68_POPDE|nr:hypothetical protein H0E87_001502 [Populus deltoides]